MGKELSDAVRKVIAEQAAQRNLTGRQLAIRAGINERSLTRKLKGDSPFDVDDLDAIADVFGVRAADLITWADPKE